MRLEEEVASAGEAGEEEQGGDEGPGRHGRVAQVLVTAVVPQLVGA